LPGGNLTALVVGLERDAGKRRLIQDDIMGKYKDVEQVGFVGLDDEEPELVMTGGEFCGNAARSATWRYLGGKPGEIRLRVSGAAQPLRAGVTAELDAWVEIPPGGRGARPVGDGAVWVEMEGISHLVLSAETSARYIRAAGLDSGAPGTEPLLRAARGLLEAHGLSGDAVGVIFTETGDDYVKIHPCVFVESAGSAMYETACGSGSAAAAIVECERSKRNATVRAMQPSGMTIVASAVWSGCRAGKVTISGKVFDMTKRYIKGGG